MKQSTLNNLRKKHRKTLRSVFSSRIPANLQWRNIESLFNALGAKKENLGGSAVVFHLCGRKIDFHTPHPQKEAKKYQIRKLRNFLISLGINHENNEL